MKNMKVLKYYIIFSIGYLILSVATAPFFMSWGSKRSIFEKAYVFFIGSPFNVGKSLWFILLNSIFWTIIIYIVIHTMKKFLMIKKNKSD